VGLWICHVQTCMLLFSRVFLRTDLPVVEAKGLCQAWMQAGYAQAASQGLDLVRAGCLEGLP
jgi:hypothetical protein